MGPREELRELVAQAGTASDAGDFARAIDLLGRGLRRHPDHPALLLLLGGAQFDLGDFDAATASFQRLLAIDPRAHTALYWIGKIHLERADARAALPYLEKAVALKASPTRLLRLGIAYERLGRTPEAENAYRRAVELDPGYDEPMCALAVLIRKRDPEEAEALLRRAIELDPAEPVSHRELGSLQCQLGRYVEAEASLRRALALDENDIDARELLAGVICWEMERSDEAEAELIEACRRAPGRALPRWLLGKLSWRMGAWDAAEAWFRKALRAEPGDPMAIKQLVRFLEHRGRSLEAAELLARLPLEEREPLPSIEL